MWPELRWLDPLAKLYFGGPRLNGYGFWAGADAHDICAALTSVPSYHWHTHHAACAELMWRQYSAFRVGALFVGGIGVVWFYGSLVWHRAFARQILSMERCHCPPVCGRGAGTNPCQLSNGNQSGSKG